MRTSKVEGGIRKSPWPGCLLLMLAPMWSPLLAAGSDVDLHFEVGGGLTAHARLRADGAIEIATNRMRQPQQLQGASDEEGRSRLDHADYNFDGYEDLASRASAGQVNETVVVHLYDAGSGAFRELKAPANTNASCEGFWSLMPDAKHRTLTSSCRSGPMWYSDVYQYDGNQLYLYRSMRLAYLETEKLEQVLSLEAEDDGPPAVWSTYDPAGKVLENAISDGLVSPAHGIPLRGNPARVVPSRLPLYAHAGDSSTGRYLVKGDRVELLDVDEGWLQVRYKNPSRGPIIGWVQSRESQ